MPTCPNGHDVDPDVAFCRQCGASLTPREEPTLVGIPLVEEPAGTRAHARSSQSNTAVYVLAGLIVIVGLAAIGYALVRGSGDDSGRPSPISQPTSNPTVGGSTPTPSPQHSSSPTAAAPPDGGTLCPGSVAGGGRFGTIGSETSCGFVQSVYASYTDTAGLSQQSGQSATVSATSPTTHKTYKNIVCTVGATWVTCVGGNNNTARMFFAHP